MIFMALFPRFSRPAVRITIEALTAYLPQLSPDGQAIAQDAIRQLRYLLDSANQDRDNRNQAKAETKPQG
jgi:hypothetical protein